MNKRTPMLNSTTLYTLHLFRVLQEERQQRYMKGPVIVEMLGITLSYLNSNISRTLTRAKLIKSKNGCLGGYRIHPDADLEKTTLEDLHKILYEGNLFDRNNTVYPTSISQLSISQAVAELNEQLNAQPEVQACQA